MTASTLGSSVPITTRSGFRKSSTAVPSFRNSGFDTTAKGCGVSAETTSRTLDAGPPRPPVGFGGEAQALRDEDALARPHRLVEVGGEAQALLGHVPRDHLVE